MDINDIQNLQEAYNQIYQVDEAKQESEEEDWRKSEIRNLRRHRQTGTRTPYTDRIVSHAKGRGVKKERGSKIQREETEIDEVNMGGKLDKKERLAMTLEGFSREEIDLYDIVFTHLLDEGYASTKEAAVAIMANMSEEWRDSILNEDPVQNFRDMQRAKQNAAGMRGPELSHSAPIGGSAAQKPQPRSREFEKVPPSSGKPKPSGGGSATIKQTGPSSPGYDTRRIGGYDLRRLAK
jgi:hypothetical protein